MIDMIFIGSIFFCHLRIKYLILIHLTHAGDVIYHSVVDAIFGALTLPDIGQVFQDTDPRWKGCDSSKFMEHAYEVMKYYGYKIGKYCGLSILQRNLMFYYFLTHLYLPKRESRCNLDPRTA